MKTEKKIGIWMDHAIAHLIEYPLNTTTEKSIELDFTNEEMEESLDKSESLMHNKRQQKQSAYYKELAEEILHYNEVLLFGPTDAKVELSNIMNEDHRFATIKIEVKQADKMTSNQQHAFVNDYFN